MLSDKAMERLKARSPVSASRSGIRASMHNIAPLRRCRVCVVQVQASVKKNTTLLVGDIGGTNARLALWKAVGPRSSAELYAKTFKTSEHKTFDTVVGEFIRDAQSAGPAPSAAALAVAGAVEDNKCQMTNLDWLVDGDALGNHYGIKVKVLNDFEAVGYGIPALEDSDVVALNTNQPKPKAPKVVMGPGTGLGAAQLMWDTELNDYKVWPGEGSHATFAPRGWKQAALAVYGASKFGGHIEVEQVACGSGLELIYEFLLTDEPANRQGVPLGQNYTKTAQEITGSCLNGTDPLAQEAVDMLMAIVGAEAGGMALRNMAKGGVYIAGGITPRLLPRLRASPSGGGSLLEGFLCRNVREKFRDILASIPLYVITNDKVGQIGARAVAAKLVQSK